MSAEEGFVDQLPEPRNLWARYRPRVWRGAESLWFELASDRLGGPRRGSRGCSPEDVSALDDVVYLPPPGPGEESLRDELAAAAVDRGLHPVVHVGLGDPVAAVPGPSRLLVDEVPRLFGGAGDAAHLAQLAFGVEVVWLVPAIAGLSVGRGREEWVAERLLELAATAAHVVEPRLEGPELRRVAEAAGAEGDPSLFHAEPADATPLLRVLHRAGLEVFLPRPAVATTDLQRDRREIAGRLGQAADLWLRVGRPPSAAQALFRAAREIDRTPLDLRALHRDGNLKVLDWLTDPAEQTVAEWLKSGQTPLLEELQTSLLG